MTVCTEAEALATLRVLARLNNGIVRALYEVDRGRISDRLVGLWVMPNGVERWKQKTWFWTRHRGLWLAVAQDEIGSRYRWGALPPENTTAPDTDKAACAGAVGGL